MPRIPKHPTTIRLPEDLKTALAAAAQEDGLSSAGLLGVLLREGLRRRNLRREKEAADITGVEVSVMPKPPITPKHGDRHGLFA